MIYVAVLPTALSQTDSCLNFCFSCNWDLNGFQTLPLKSGWKNGVCDPDPRPVLFLWGFTPDLWSTQRCLRSQANCRKPADETNWFSKHVFENHISCEKVTDLLMQCPHWLRSQDLFANTLNLNVESRLDVDPTFVVAVGCGQCKVNLKLQFKPRSTCLLQLARRTVSILILCRSRDFSLLCRFWFCWQACLGLEFNTADKVKLTTVPEARSYDHNSKGQQTCTQDRRLDSCVWLSLNNWELDYAGWSRSPR